ncbi:hypothetical protein GCM10027589_39740 [Actinocorallia lasiicapitis]
MSAIDDCLADALTFPGARLVTLLDHVSGLPIAALGPDSLTAEEDASGTADLIQKALATPAITAAHTADTLTELIVVGTAGTHVILLGADALCLHAVLDPAADLVAARSRLWASFHRLAAPHG